MKKYMTLLLLVLLSCNEDNKVEQTEHRVWELADIPTLNFDEFEPMLIETSNRIQVINFWATWCAPCVEEMPYFEDLAEKYKDKIDLKFVSLDRPEEKESKVLVFANKKNIRNDIILLDDPRSHYWIPKVYENWSGATPATLIFNADTRLFYEKPFSKEELERELKKFM